MLKSDASIAADIPGALTDMVLDVKEDFVHNRVIVHVTYQRHAVAVIDADLYHEDPAGNFYEAAKQATAILRDDVRRALGHEIR